MTMPSLSEARTARLEADRRRAAALLAVAEGELTVTDVVRAAADDNGRALLRLSLRQLLLAQPGWGEERARQVTAKILDIVGADSTPDRVTLAWLLDSRAAGRRFMALCDALHINSAAPWGGFPFAPKPTKSMHTRSAR